MRLSQDVDYSKEERGEGMADECRIIQECSVIFALSSAPLARLGRRHDLSALHPVGRVLRRMAGPARDRARKS